MTTKECASCADGRADHAAFCEECGRQLDAPPCPNCGTPGGVGADGYCENCGMLAGRPRDHMSSDVGPAVAATDRGLRHHRNEDAYWLTARGADVDAVVCDGVSSSFDPDVASEAAANAAGEALSIVKFSDDADNVIAAVLAAGEAVADLARSGDPRRAVSNPACTIVAATVRGADVTVGWVGDSRAYWVPALGPAEQLTEDDSWATHAIAMGADPVAALRDPKAHAITAWLGADAGTIRPRTGAFTVREDGHLVICSDGLWNYLPDATAFGAQVRQALALPTLLEAGEALVEYAKTAGGADNITVVLVPVAPAPSSPGADTADLSSHLDSSAADSSPAADSAVKE